MAYQSLFWQNNGTARDRSAVMMRRFLDGGDVACDFDSNDDDKDDYNILHFDLRGPAAVVWCQPYTSTEFLCVDAKTHPKIGSKIC
jgi:hypothetical protein